MNLSEIVDSLRRPSAYDHAVDGVIALQTHISWVLLAGDYAYKIKKPVRFDFLDYSTLALRKQMCERELSLNRRTCPDAYLGVVPIVERDGAAYLYGAGEPVEWAVKMRRLPESGWLSRHVDDGDASPDLLRRVAADVHAFHSRAETGREIARFGSASEVADIWHENISELTDLLARTPLAQQLPAVAAFGERFLAANRRLLDERAASGRVRDGHGDLRSDSIFVEPGGHICMTDCIEFSDRLRCGDVASDVAFLAMDLDVRDRPDLSDELSGAYVSLAFDDETLPSMLPFYRCYRAAVRCKVENIAARQQGIDREEAAKAAHRAARYLTLAGTYASEAAPPALVIVGGLSGTGKSHLACALAARVGAVLVRTDAVRRSIADTLSYSAGDRERAYAAARDRARSHLDQRRTVILDATHLSRADRDAARTLAEESGVPALLAWVSAPEDVVRQRLEARDAATGSLSDARWQTYLGQQKRFEPLTESEKRNCLELDGTRAATANIARVRQRLAG